MGAWSETSDQSGGNLHSRKHKLIAAAF